METWDLLDAARSPLGRTHQRGEALPEHTYHAVVFVWVADRRGRFLLTRRAPEKKSYPDCWGCTGGSVLAGETSLQGVRRELYEETGIDAPEGEFRLLETIRERDMFCDLYFLALEHDPGPLRLQPGETVEAGWFSLEQLRSLPDLAEPDRQRLALLAERLEQSARAAAQ